MRITALVLFLVPCPFALPAQSAVPAGPGCDSPAACLALGRSLYSGQGISRDQPRALSAFEAACERGEFAGCTWVGFMLEGGRGVPADPARAARQYDRACTGAGTASDKEGCAYLAELYRRGVGVPRDPVRAWRLNTQACEADQSLGCVQLGHQLQAGEGAPRDSAAAVPHFERGCRLNGAAACRALAWVFREGQGAPRDHERATALFKQNCDLRSDALSCVNIGYAYQNALGVDASAASAVRYYTKACDANQPVGCANLGNMLANGLGTARDSSKAQAAYERGCRLDDPRSCNDLGLLVERAPGAARNLQRAAELYERACGLGNPAGCRNFGLALQNGDGVARDPTRALDYFDRACRSGWADGCNSLGVAHERGLGVPVNLATALRHFEAGCTARSPWACTNLARLLRGVSGVDAAPRRSFELLEKACTVDHLPYACSELGFNYQYGHGTRIDDQRAIALYAEGCSGGREDACGRMKELAPDQPRVAGGGVVSVDAEQRSAGGASTAAQAGADRAREGTIWILAVGISSYQADSARIRPLRYADSDAMSLFQHLTGPNGPGIAPARRFLLQNQQATATAIREHLTGATGLGGTLEQDTVIIFLAGHGTPDPQNPRAPPYFLAWDTDPDRLASTALPMNDLESAISARLRAGVILLIVDACHGGGIANGGARANQAINSAVRSLAADRSRAIIAVTSASENQTAAESPSYGGGHGLFTWKLLEGLQGAADRNADGTVTLDEVLLHLQRAVPAIRPEQNPTYQASPNARLAFPLARRVGRTDPGGG